MTKFDFVAVWGSSNYLLYSSVESIKTRDHISNIEINIALLLYNIMALYTIALAVLNIELFLLVNKLAL